jgi:hypothetical protein
LRTVSESFCRLTSISVPTFSIAIVIGGAAGLGLAIAKISPVLGTKLVVIDKDIDYLSTEPKLAALSGDTLSTLTNAQRVMEMAMRVIVALIDRILGL